MLFVFTEDYTDLHVCVQGQWLSFGVVDGVVIVAPCTKDAQGKYGPGAWPAGMDVRTDAGEVIAPDALGKVCWPVAQRAAVVANGDFAAAVHPPRPAPTIVMWEQ